MILVLLPLWKREQITDICLQNLRNLKETQNIEVLCIVSETSAKVKAFEYGFKWVESVNFPVSNKMNNGIEAALKIKGWNYLMNLGSDDIIDNRLFDLYNELIEQNYPCFGITKATFFCSNEKKAKRVDYKHMIGAGRMIHRSVIEKYNPIYPDNKNKCLDGLSERKMFGVPFKEIDTDKKDLIIDIKSNENLWKFDEIEGVEINLDQLKINDNNLTKLLEL